jgi:hypothetical protein
MLATVRLLRESFLNNGEWPFNQYGLFWAFPYTLLSLFVDGGNLLVAIRVFTLLLYAGTGYFTYKIAFDMYGNRIAKFSLLLFIILRPVGLEPLPWPSSISMILTITSLWLLLCSLKPKSYLHANIYVAISGALTSANLFSRVQVGFLILISTTLVLAKFQKRLSVYFIAGFLSFTSLFFAFLVSKDWLAPALKDEFLFGWLIASSEETDRSLPKTSIVIAVAVLLIILSHRYGWFNSIRFGKHLTIIVLSGIALAMAFNQQAFKTLYGKFVVGLVLGFVVMTMFQFWKSWVRKQVNQVLLTIFALASASQIYPLFDVMHAWWGVSPLVIVMASDIYAKRLNAANKGLLFFVSTACALLIIFPYVNSVRAGTTQVSHEDINLVRLPSNAQSDYKEMGDFLQKNLDSKSRVLNLCSDARVFFSPRFSNSASRYFVYWKTMGNSSQITQEILKAKPTHVLVCEPFRPGDDDVTNRFTSEPYFEVAQSDGVSIYSTVSKSAG